MNIHKKKIGSNILTVSLLIIAAALFIFPGFKAWTIRGLMKAGFFQPQVTAGTSTAPDAGTASVPFVSISGETQTIGSLKGKVVFINFWATWCPPCIAELPAIHALYASLKKNPDIVFLLVDADNDLPKATAFLKKQQLQLPVSAVGGTLPASWYNGTLPTTLVLDKTGNLVYHHEGVADYNSKKFREFLEGLAD